MLDVSALNAGQPTPKLMPRRTTATTKAGTVVANASTRAPSSWAALPQEHDDPRAEPVGERPDRDRDEQRDDRR